MGTEQVKALLEIIKEKERENWELKQTVERLTNQLCSDYAQSFYLPQQIKQEYIPFEDFEQSMENEWLKELERQVLPPIQETEMPFEKDVYMMEGEKETVMPPPVTNQEHRRNPKRKYLGNGASTSGTKKH